MELNTVLRLRQAFFRLVGTEAGDTELVVQGEDTNDVVDTCLTHGVREAQRDLLSYGYRDWMLRSATLVTAESGGVVSAPLPADVLKVDGDERQSPLIDTQGRRWGSQVDDRRRDEQGDKFWFPNHRTVVFNERASIPSGGLRLDYFGRHEPLGTDVTINFPSEVAGLIVAHAAEYASSENWLPGFKEMQAGIQKRLVFEQAKAGRFARTTRQQRKMNPTTPMVGTRY